MRIPSVPVIDLFAGPGGLGEGFSAFSGARRTRSFKISLSIEKDEVAHSTLQLRAFYRQFEAGAVPEDYYEVLRGALSVPELYKAHPRQAAAAKREAWNATLGVTPAELVKARISAALDGAQDWVLIGGPPCQAYSIAGRSRNRGIKGYEPEADHRQYLYIEYLRVIADHWPAIFVMENVQGLLTANLAGGGVMKKILADLESPESALSGGDHKAATGRRGHHYRVFPLAPALSDQKSVAKYIVHAERHGIPQSRHRVILVGIRDDLARGALKSLQEFPEVPLGAVIDGLPRLRSGLSAKDSPERWLGVMRSASERRWVSSSGRTGGEALEASIRAIVSDLKLPRRDRGRPFIEGEFEPAYRPEWFSDSRLRGVCHHETRGHLALDLHRYLFAACFGQAHRRSPALNEFPADLLPDHKNVGYAMETGGYFSDRFRVQLHDRPAKTITSHIAKDGHYYIHPDPTQCRALTLREAARIQTFPDNYYFCGPRTKGYSQVGNAVPPLLARAIAESVWDLLEQNGLV